MEEISLIGASYATSGPRITKHLRKWGRLRSHVGAPFKHNGKSILHIQVTGNFGLIKKTKNKKKNECRGTGALSTCARNVLRLYLVCLMHFACAVDEIWSIEMSERSENGN